MGKYIMLGMDVHDATLVIKMAIGTQPPAARRVDNTAQRRRMSDEHDAQQILEALRGHLLGGNELPDVWIPDLQTRQDREIVRARLDVAEWAN